MMTEEELARLANVALALPADDRALVTRAATAIRQLRRALAEDYAARLYYGDQSRSAAIWEVLPPEVRADYRRQARARLNDDVVAWLARRAERSEG